MHIIQREYYVWELRHIGQPSYSFSAVSVQLMLRARTFYNKKELKERKLTNNSLMTVDRNNNILPVAKNGQINS